MKSFILPLVIAMAAAENPNSIYNTCFSSKPKYNPNYRPKQAHKELREFCIKGQKVMAYSRKDAIIRLKHKKGGK